MVKWWITLTSVSYDDPIGYVLAEMKVTLGCSYPVLK